MSVDSTARTEMHMQIGFVGERTDLSIRTLRWHEEVGLVVPSCRTAGGFRHYTDDDVERLRTIRRMKPLGFTLEEMKRLLSLLDLLADDSADPPSPASCGRLRVRVP